MLAFEAIVVTKLKQDNRVNDFEKPVHTGVQSPHLHKKSNMSQIKNKTGKIIADSDVSLIELIKQNKSRLEEADLRNIDLSGEQLQYIVLRKADIRNAKFKDADISESSLDGIDAQEANFENANMKGAFVQKGNLEKAILRRTTLTQVDFENAILKKADLTESRAEINVNFENANLENAHLNNVDLSTFDGENANLKNAELKNARISILELGNANLNNADMTGLETQFEHLSLQGADLTKAKMQTFAQHSPLFCATANTATNYYQIKREYPGVRWDEPPLLSDCGACEHCISEKIAA